MPSASPESGPSASVEVAPVVAPVARPAVLSRQPPAGPWARTLIAAGALALLLLGALELIWRTHGEQPSVTDDAKLWAMERGRVYGKNVIAVVGGSRAVLGVSMPTLQHRLPKHTPVMLAIHGTSPWLILKDLLEDKRFRGTIVVDIDESQFDRVRTGRSPRPRKYLAAFHEGLQLDQQLNSRAGAELRSRFTVLAAHLSLGQVLRTFVETGALPVPEFAVAHVDRSRSADYSRVDVKRQVEIRIKGLRGEYRKRPPPAAAEWVRRMGTLEGGIRALKKRGGDVVFVRPPTTGRLREIHEAAYPRETYWDAWSKTTRAKTVHFADVPRMANLPCPDGSHLDMKDAPEFTEALVDELQRLDVVRTKK